MAVEEVDAVDIVHDGGAEEHVAVVLRLRQAHASEIQRISFRPGKWDGIMEAWNHGNME